MATLSPRVEAAQKAIIDGLSKDCEVALVGQLCQLVKILEEHDYLGDRISVTSTSGGVRYLAEVCMSINTANIPSTFLDSIVGGNQILDNAYLRRVLCFPNPSGTCGRDGKNDNGGHMLLVLELWTISDMRVITASLNSSEGLEDRKKCYTDTSAHIPQDEEEGNIREGVLKGFVENTVSNSGVAAREDYDFLCQVITTVGGRCTTSLLETSISCFEQGNYILNLDGFGVVDYSLVYRLLLSNKNPGFKERIAKVEVYVKDNPDSGKSLTMGLRIEVKRLNKKPVPATNGSEDAGWSVFDMLPFLRRPSKKRKRSQVDEDREEEEDTVESTKRQRVRERSNTK